MSATSTGKPYQKKSIPVISFLWYKIKNSCLSKLCRKQKDTQIVKSEHKKRFNLNIFPKIGIISPKFIFGHILQWYQIPLVLGIVLSFIAGYYLALFYHLLNKKDLLYLFQLILLGLCVIVIILIGALVAILRAFDIKYDLVGDGKYLLDAEGVLSVAERLAWSTASPEIEDAFWVSDFIKELWPYLNTYLIRLISNICPNCSLDPLLGEINQILKLEVDKVYLGDNVPSITGIHVVKRGSRREDMIIECEFTYDGDVLIGLKGNYGIKAGISWIYFKGKFRIILSPLFRELPVLGNIEITLIEKPKLNWRFYGILCILNWDLLKDLIKCLLTYFLLNPHKFSFKLAKEIPVSELKLREPKGMLRIEVISADNLPAMDTRALECIPGCAGKSDPYCVIKVEEQEMWTHVISQELNPVWNREFCFLVHDSIKNLISMNIWDEDMIEDDFIGKFEIPIEVFSENKYLNGQEVTVPLVDKEDKPLKKKSTLSFRVSYFQLSTDAQKLEVTAGQARTQLPVAALSVLVDSASGLETSALRSAELRPLVRISVGNQIRITSIKRRTGYPVWEEAHHFVLYSPKLETIYIEVIDMYSVEEKQLVPIVPINVGNLGKFADLIGLSSKGTVLGHYSVPTVDILNAHRMKMEGSYRLQGFVEEGYIRLLMAIRIAEFEPIVAENIRKPRTLLSEVIAYQKQHESAVTDEEKSIQKDNQNANDVNVTSNLLNDEQKDDKNNVTNQIKKEESIENSVKGDNTQNINI